MEYYLRIILLGGGCFLAAAMVMASRPELLKRLTTFFAAISAVGGVVFYGYGFLTKYKSVSLAIVRMIYCICLMFVGGSDDSVLQGTALFQNGPAIVLFWSIHLFAFYTTICAVISTVGSHTLKKLRLWLSRWTELNVIYGFEPKSIELGKGVLAQKNGFIVFVDDGVAPKALDGQLAIGCIFRSDTEALDASVRFLKSIGIRGGRRKINLYAMKEDPEENLQYAERFKKSLQERKAVPEQAILVIRAPEGSYARRMQVRPREYGYGYVTVFQEPELAARILNRMCPPCDSISFDGDARAKEDFEAVIVGFGKMGQAVLKSLVKNGQFAGSVFRAAVFAPDCDAVSGSFAYTCGQVLERYDITFHTCDGRSRQMYEYLSGRGERIKYLVVCTGDPQRNREIADELIPFLHAQQIRCPVCLCAYQGVTVIREEKTQTEKLHCQEVLAMGKIDTMAMIINSHYLGQSSRGYVADWMNCDYFSRMSSRASADYIPAVLRGAGKTASQVLSGDWALSDAQKRNLSESEHKRWCAFHYCMGFRPMEEAEYQERAREYLSQVAAGEEKPIRIGKNMAAKTHACLIEWEALDSLSRKETEITGKQVDYQAIDLENVLIVPELLRTAKTAGGKMEKRNG